MADIDLSTILSFIIPILLAFAISLLNFIGEKISEKMRKWHSEIQSFGAGLMVGILFLELLPHIASGQEHLDQFIYIPFLIGFTVIAMIEKIVYKRMLKDNSKIDLSIEEINSIEENKIENISPNLSESKEEIECREVEQNILFEGVAIIAHDLLIGLLIALTFETEGTIVYILLIPLVIRAFTLAVTSEQIFEEMEPKQEKIIRILSLIAPPIGATIGVFLVFNKIVLFIFFAFSLGLILYIVIRDMIPLGKKGKPIIFMSGILLSISIFLIFEILVFKNI